MREANSIGPRFLSAGNGGVTLQWVRTALPREKISTVALSSVHSKIFLDHLEQGSCGVGMKIHLNLSDLLFNVHCELVRQTSEYDSFCENVIAKMVDIFGEYLKLGCHVYMICFVVLFFVLRSKLFLRRRRTSLSRPLSETSRNAKEKCSDSEKQCFLYVRDRWNLSRNIGLRNLHYVRMDGHAVHFWQRALNSSRVFWNLNYSI